MSYFITVPDAMREFDGIREAQILEIINHGWAAPYDEQGHRLTPEKFHALVHREIQSAIDRAREDISDSLRVENGWGGRIAPEHNRRMRRNCQDSIEYAQESMPRDILHSMRFKRLELESAIRL